MNTGKHPQARALLWREAVGAVLRQIRLRRRLRLVDVAERAGVSAQYLSEMERGMKDPSSEMLAAAAGALGLGVGELARLAANVMARSGLAAARDERVLVLESSVGRAAMPPGSMNAGLMHSRACDSFLLAA